MKGTYLTMNDPICSTNLQEKWRTNLRELRDKLGVNNAWIADKENLSKKSVDRVFNGESKSPSVDLVRRIIHALGSTWQEIFGESSAVIGGQDLATLQAEVTRLADENAKLLSSLNIANLDLTVQKEKVSALEAEIKLLNLKIEYEEKLIAVHNFYNKI
jgi:transcriptional regulator with XRE-family HTH domain